MIRVLNVVHYPVFGGPHNQALRLASPLATRGWDTLVLMPDERGTGHQRLKDAGIPVLTMPLGRVRSLRNVGANVRMAATLVPEVAAIRRVIRQRNVGLVQLNGLMNPHAAFAARLEGRPIVWQLLDTRVPRPAAVLSMVLVRWLADAVMSTGRIVARSHPGGAALGDRLFAYFPPVDTDLFRPRPEERMRIRKEWRASDDRQIIGCVANLNPQKGITDLIRAFAHVRVTRPNTQLVLIGSEHPTHAAYSAEIRGVMRACGLSPGRDVSFLGGRNDVHLQLAGMDVFAFAPTPRGEGISTVVLEAMAAGLPVIATAVAGLPEAISHPNDGVLVRPADPRAMGDAIAGVLADPEAMPRLGAAARDTAVLKFSIDSAVAAHIAAYERAMAR